MFQPTAAGVLTCNLQLLTIFYIWEDMVLTLRFNSHIKSCSSWLSGCCSG